MDRRKSSFTDYGTKTIQEQKRTDFRFVTSLKSFCLLSSYQFSSPLSGALPQKDFVTALFRKAFFAIRDFKMGGTTNQSIFEEKTETEVLKTFRPYSSRR